MNKIFTKSILAGKLCLILIGLLGLISVQGHAQITEYAIIRDVSESNLSPSSVTPELLLKQVILDAELATSGQGLNLRTALCGEHTIPEVMLTQLAEQRGLLASTATRNQSMRQFLIQAHADLAHLLEQPCDHRQTNLYRTLCAVVEQMEGTAQTKTLIIFSDLAEVSKMFNTRKYERNPKQLLTHYQEIRAAFDADKPLPDLDGFQIILITPGSTEFQLALARFWKKMLQSQGAKVQIKASL